ncbi:odorant receptor Or2-like [Anoplophora glabripennis]|uniref:odorant receptor Or2-like n=1 Tax=Anoplophora glabripennis TaxID=217634 RepID=UPI0008737CFB|nr:odorant receptor Or2-like [Anoplophora glabripennis]
MGFLPQVLHFKVAMYFSVCIGLWPLITTKNKTVRKLYEIMSKLHYIYFNLFCFTQLVQLVVLLMEDQVNYTEVVNNLCILFIYFNSALRCKSIKGKAIRNVIKDVGKSEKKLWESMDENLKKIYNENVKRNNLFCKIFAGNTLLTNVGYAIWPLFMEKQTVEINNTTMEVKYLPISAWMPFDVQKHYVSAYLLLLFNCNYLCTMFFISTEALAFGLMTYPLGQIHMLNHILRNFRKYKDSLQRSMNLKEEAASETQLRECIVKHQDIIKYVDIFNAEMKHTYLLDFLQCSLQLTCVLYRFMSLAVSDELYSMEWLDETQKVKKMILFMIMRGQRPLILFIGIFKAMSLEVFVTPIVGPLMWKRHDLRPVRRAVGVYGAASPHIKAVIKHP